MSNHARIRRHRGAALVEFALVITVFLMLVLGIMEFGAAFMVNHTMISAAREGARLAAVTANLTANDPRVDAAAQGVLTAAGIRNARVSNTALLGTNDTVRVTVSLKYDLITGVGKLFGKLDGWEIKRYCEMRHET